MIPSLKKQSNSWYSKCMQETTLVSPSHESTLKAPVTEVIPQVESEEKRKIFRVLQRSFTRLENAYDRKSANKTLTEEERIGFVVTNIDYYNSNRGEQVSVQSFTDPDGTKRSIRRNVPLNHILKQLDEDIALERDEKVKSELQADKKYLLDHSRPLLRNDNRKELADRIIDRRATLLARAITGSDADAPNFREQAKQAIENERELVVPNPRFRVDVEDVMSKPRTTEDLIQKLDAILPPSDSIKRTTPLGRFGRMQRSPRNEARRMIAENNALLRLKEQQDRKAKQIEAENRTALVRGALSETLNVLSSKKEGLSIPERIAAMQNQTNAMNAAMDKLTETMASPAEASSLQSLQNEEVPVMTGGEDEHMSALDSWDPIALGDRAGEHPEEFEVEASDIQEANDIQPVGVVSSSAVATAGKTEAAEVTPLDAASLVLQSKSAEVSPEDNAQKIPQVSDNSVNTELYRAIHNAANTEVAPITSPQLPVTPAPHKSFISRLADALGLKAA